MIPIGDKEIILYSVDGGVLEWKLPSQWAGANVSVAPVDLSVAAEQRYDIGSDSKVQISTKGRTAYVVKQLK